MHTIVVTKCTSTNDDNDVDESYYQERGRGCTSLNNDHVMQRKYGRTTHGT